MIINYSLQIDYNKLLQLINYWAIITIF